MNEPQLQTRLVHFLAARSTRWAAYLFILLAYWLVWLPQPVVGLSFIGLEMGEWVKFLPQMQSGEIGISRNLFYLPPIFLGLLLALESEGWSNRRWQSWVWRGMAVVVSLLAFPALEAIRFEGADQWLLRLVLVTVVAAVALGSGWGRRLPVSVILGVMLLLALLGALLPTWAYFAVRPVAAQVFQTSVGVGPGVWLNLGGFLLAAACLLAGWRSN